jgi:hypothetical protein
MLLFSWYDNKSASKESSKLSMWPEAQVSASYLKTVKPIRTLTPKLKQAHTELNNSPPSEA